MGLVIKKYFLLAHNSEEKSMERIVALGKAVPVILDKPSKRKDVPKPIWPEQSMNTKIRDALDYLNRIKSRVDSAYSDASACEEGDITSIEDAMSSLRAARSDLDSLENMLTKMM